MFKKNSTIILRSLYVAHTSGYFKLLLRILFILSIFLWMEKWPVPSFMPWPFLDMFQWDRPPDVGSVDHRVHMYLMLLSLVGFLSKRVGQKRMK